MGQTTIYKYYLDEDDVFIIELDSIKNVTFFDLTEKSLILTKGIENNHVASQFVYFTGSSDVTLNREEIKNMRISPQIITRTFYPEFNKNYVFIGRYINGLSTRITDDVYSVKFTKNKYG